MGCEPAPVGSVIRVSDYRWNERLTLDTFEAVVLKSSADDFGHYYEIQFPEQADPYISECGKSWQGWISTVLHAIEQVA